MAEIVDSGGGGGKGKHQKKRAKKHSARIDMTPMVDLGFLLLTFFVLTSQFSKPKTMEITMPVIPDDTVTMKIEDQTALTLLLTENPEKLYYYYGKFKPDASIIQTTDYSKDGIRKILRDRNKGVIDKVEELKEQLMKNQIADTTYKRKAMEVRGDKEATFVIIKADDKAKYKNVIDVFDELSINDVDKKALVDISPAEKKILEFIK